MTVIPFQRTNDPLDFDGNDIDTEEQQESWAAIFASMQFALRFCAFNHVEAEKVVRKFLDRGHGDLLDNMSADWSGDINRLETLIAIMKSAAARLEISKDRALGRAARGGK